MVDPLWLLTLQQLKDLERRQIVSLRTGYLTRNTDMEVIGSFWFRHRERPETTLGFSIYYSHHKTRIRVETSPEWSHNFQGDAFEKFKSVCHKVDNSEVKPSTGMVGTMCAFFVDVRNPSDDLDWQKAGYITLLKLARGLTEAGFIVPAKSE